jgi:hypothetical protein
LGGDRLADGADIGGQSLRTLARVPDKPAPSSRQAAIDEVRKQQRAAERRRGFLVVGVCAVVAVVIVAGAVLLMVRGDDDNPPEALTNLPLESLGAPASACAAITTFATDGSQRHLPTGTQTTYPTAPPAFGSHWSEPGIAPAPFSRKFYAANDRPELEVLVHNLEHGYTILWYDESIADDADQLDVVQAIADKFAGSDDIRFKVIAAPWTADDEAESGSFPDGQHVAVSHWSAGGSGETDPAKQVGVFQYCSAPSGAALTTFMLDFPYSDSPEPFAM